MNNEKEIRKKFDMWYRDQKEMNPYIMRDYWLQVLQEELNKKVGEIREAIEFERVSFWSPNDGGKLEEYTKANNKVIENLLNHPSLQLPKQT